jgi:hypothetical protein
VFALDGYTWIDRTSSGAQDWITLVSSSSGQYLAGSAPSNGGNSGYIYTSNDYGATWIKQVGSASAGGNYALGMSADGKYLAAANGGNIYTSNDYGVTWTDQVSSQQGAGGWETIQISGDGQYMLGTIDGGDIYTSNNYGVTWTDEHVGTQSWYGSAMSQSGQYMTAGAYGQNIYQSSNYGATWTPEASSGSHAWAWMASSASGQYVAAATYSGNVYTSADYGVSWTDQTATSSFEPSFITSSASGQYLAAGAGSLGSADVYTSNDYGVTWTDQTDGPQNTEDIAYSASGQYLAAASYGGDIYTADNTSFAPPALVNQAISLRSGSSSTVNVLSGVANADSSTLSIVTPPLHGTAVDPSGTITYSPNADYVGPDSLVFQVCSSLNSLSCSQATLSFTVTAAVVSAPDTGYGQPLPSSYPIAAVFTGALISTSAGLLLLNKRKSN